MCSEANIIASRINRAAAQILDNERLTAELDDQAAKTLIDWGISCTTIVVGATESLGDEAAEKVTYPRLKAVRRMMREISKWAVTPTEDKPQAAQVYYPKVIEQAVLIYGDSFSKLEALNAQPDLAFAKNPYQLIQQLRLALDPNQKTNEIG